jgi:hypothetical protein
MASSTRARPWRQVLIRVKNSAAMASGNQPPSTNLIAQPANSATSTTRNRAVAGPTTQAGSPQARRTTT